MDKHVNPPAITKEEAKEILASCRRMYADITQAERLNLQKAIQLGKALEQLRQSAEVGSYTANLKDIGISRTRALQLRRLAALPVSAGVASCASIREAMMLLSDPEKEDPECPERKPVYVPDTPSAKSLPATNSSPWVDQGAGAQPTQAPVQSRADRVGQKPPTAFVPKDREPGDDSQSEAAAKEQAKRTPPNGAEDFSIRTVHEHFGKLIWSIGQLAHKAGCDKSGGNKMARPLVMTPRQAGIERLLQEAQKEIEKWHAEVLRGTSKSRSNS